MINPAFILWLIRQRIVTDWIQLCNYFGILSTDDGSESYYLTQKIRSMENCGLLAVSDAKYSRSRKNYVSASFEYTNLFPKIQGIFKISLTELARSDPENGTFLAPIFGKPKKKGYGRDILVLMPFADALNPVYNNHIKQVAKKLDMSIARADDFFSEQSIIQEIWWAIIQSNILIADCTGRNPNVFYEIGMAHVAGKPVILITQNDDDIPFDLKHRRYLTYKYTPHGMKLFKDKLAKTLLTIKQELDILPQE